MRKLIVTVCFLLMITSITYASVCVEYDDIYYYKDRVAHWIQKDLNNTGVSDNNVYRYIIRSINNSLNSYSSFPMYIYLDDDGDIVYATFSPSDDIFSAASIKFITVQSKATFLRTIYKSMNSLDLSSIERPDYLQILMQNNDKENIYILEVNLSSYPTHKLEDECSRCLQNLYYYESFFDTAIDNSHLQLVITTYVEENDELTRFIHEKTN